MVETLHGVPFEVPLSRLNAYTAVCRQLCSGEGAQVQGRALQVPLREGAKPMKLLTQRSPPCRFWWASPGDASVTVAAELADGWLPFLFLPDRWGQVWGSAVRAGVAPRDDALGPLQVAADVTVAIGEKYVTERADDVLAEHRAHLALHVGGMGPRGRNAYDTIAREYGFEAEAEKVQDLFLDGRREARLAAHREAGVTMSRDLRRRGPGRAGRPAAARSATPDDGRTGWSAPRRSC